MGINSTEVAYGFGQLGSGFSNEDDAVTPPTGKVIIAVSFLADTTFAAMVADTGVVDTAYFSHTTAVANNGGGASETDSGTVFPKGMTIYGRWTSITPSGDSATGGAIYYFGY